VNDLGHNNNHDNGDEDASFTRSWKSSSSSTRVGRVFVSVLSCVRPCVDMVLRSHYLCWFVCYRSFGRANGISFIKMQTALQAYARPAELCYGASASCVDDMVDCLDVEFFFFLVVYGSNAIRYMNGKAVCMRLCVYGHSKAIPKWYFRGRFRSRHNHPDRALSAVCTIAVNLFVFICSL
jgi:hypothetical protein